jgi:HlyD family secretion protein
VAWEAPRGRSGQRDLARIDHLATDALVSGKRWIEAKASAHDETACSTARSRTSQLASQLEVARNELAKTVLKAPFDGVIGDLSVERGEWITPSPPGIPMPSAVDLIDPDAIYVSAPLDEVDLEKVSDGQPVRITMDSYPGRAFPGRITRIAPYVLDVAEQSRTFDVEATFDDAAFARTVRPGLGRYRGHPGGPRERAARSGVRAPRGEAGARSRRRLSRRAVGREQGVVPSSRAKR